MWVEVYVVSEIYVGERMRGEYTGKAKAWG
jgi:hypothetical protein